MNSRNNRIKRKLRVRGKIKGTELRPRLSVYRSNRFVYAQIINDDKAQTIVSASEKELENTKIMKTLERAKAVGMLIAKRSKEKKIQKVLFDRGSYLYHGKIKALADGAREGGLEF